MNFIHAIISTSLISVVAAAAQANAADPKSIDHNQVFLTLSKSNTAKSVRFIEEYPGMFDPTLQGHPAGRVVQDCLLVQDVKGIDQNKLDLLLDGLVARNGSGVLFGTPNDVDDRDLVLIHTNGRFAFLVTELSTYRTGIEIRTKDKQKTFGQLVKETLGANAKDLNITLSRGCHPVL